jgi:hypothetical protein
MRECRTCGKALQKGACRRSRPAKYCSDACRAEGHRQTQRRRNEKRRSAAACSRCGGDLAGDRARYARSVCGACKDAAKAKRTEAARAASLARTNHKRTCAVCGAGFKKPESRSAPWLGATKTCSAECGSRYMRARAHMRAHEGLAMSDALVRVAMSDIGRHPRIHDALCRRCGREFQTDGRQTYCTKACANEAMRKYENPKEAQKIMRREYKRRLRQRQRETGITCRGTPIVQPQRPKGSWRPPRLPKNWRPCSKCGVYYIARQARRLVCRSCWFGRVMGALEIKPNRPEGAPGSFARALWNKRRNAARREARAKVGLNIEPRRVPPWTEWWRGGQYQSAPLE